MTPAIKISVPLIGGGHVPLRLAARHVNVHRRLAVRRVTRLLGVGPGSGAPTAMTVASGSLSTVAHIALTALVIWGPTVQFPDASHDPAVSSRFLYPLMKPHARPVQEHIRFIGVGAPASAASRESAAPRRDAAKPLDGTEVAVLPAPQDTTPLDLSQPFTELQVDEAAARDPESEGPSYPEALLEKKIEGEARVRFVVDSTGRADVTTFAVIDTNEPGFGEAVRVALPKMRFRPASIGSKRVSQHVEQTFMFRITPAAPIP